MDEQPFETEQDDQESNRLYALQPMHHLTSELVINTHKPFNEERLRHWKVTSNVGSQNNVDFRDLVTRFSSEKT